MKGIKEVEDGDAEEIIPFKIYTVFLLVYNHFY
jgi:hypothetical protein